MRFMCPASGHSIASVSAAAMARSGSLDISSACIKMWAMAGCCSRPAALADAIDLSQPAIASTTSKPRAGRPVLTSHNRRGVRVISASANSAVMVEANAPIQSEIEPALCLGRTGRNRSGVTPEVEVSHVPPTTRRTCRRLDYAPGLVLATIAGVSGILVCDRLAAYRQRETPDFPFVSARDEGDCRTETPRYDTRFCPNFRTSRSTSSTFVPAS
jgi:hypothetical protein